MRATSTARPFLRWPGGKQLLADEIRAALPEFEGRYFEPFLGAGALYFRLRPERAVLSDINPHLIDAFTIVRDEPEALIEWLSRQEVSSARYSQIRSWAPRTRFNRACRFVYLNRTAFNGIWRVNRNGKFNVPFGAHRRADVIQADRIRVAGKALAGVELVASDFRGVLRRARKGDLVYADPPYTVAHGTNGFRKYNESFFPWADQEQLAKVAHRLVDRGVNVVVSNADHPSVAALYAAFERQELDRPSRLAADAARRGRVTESLFVKRPSRR